MEKKFFDVLIVGGGVAGMSAAIYAKRRGKKVAIIERYALGGVVNTISEIENFPSQSKIDGFTLAQMFAKQVKSLQVEIIYDEIVSTNFLLDEKSLKGKKAEYFCKSVIIATGLSYVKLNVDVDKFLGQGVSYCAVCDGNFYRNQKVCVASKKGSGILGAKYLSQICEKVTLLDSEDMSVFSSANKNEKIDIVSNAKILSVEGNETLQRIKIDVSGAEKTIETNALFVELGKKASTDLFEGIEVDAKGFVVTDENMQTNILGVFAVGDVRSKNLRQIVTACSEGAIAGNNA